MGRQERQLGFSDWQRSVVKKQTRREKFLSEMEKVVPWSALLSLIALCRDRKEEDLPIQQRPCCGST